MGSRLEEVILQNCVIPFLNLTNPERRSKSLAERDVLPPNAGDAGAVTAATAAARGIELAVEFKPVEHPIEPLNNDLPVNCPLPEPSILNDRNIWKQPMSANSRRRADLPVRTHLESEVPGTRPRPAQSNRLILPSVSAPEHIILKLLEECNASGY